MRVRHRLLSLPAQVRSSYDLTSLHFVLHGAAAWPIALKRAMTERAHRVRVLQDNSAAVQSTAQRGLCRDLPRSDNGKFV
jgi:hypothetical protein